MLSNWFKKQYIMKKIVFLFLITFFLETHAQQINYTSIRKTVAELYPEIDFSNKLLAVCVWGSENSGSREQNKEFDKTAYTYQGAKLKGGLKGTVFISVCSDKNKTSFDIAKQKDNLTVAHIICDENGFDANGKLQKMALTPTTQNIVFDTNGNIIYTNLSTENIFKSFNSLITR